MDEGWTRWLLEQFGYDSTSLFDPEIKKGDLNAKFDVIVIPDDSTATLTGEPAPAGRRGGGGEFGGRSNDTPPEYRTGFGEVGVTALRNFVQNGGTIVTLGTASDFAMDKLGVRARNILADTTSKQFWCPGSTLKVNVDTNSPLAYGMPKESLALYLSGDPVFAITPSSANEKYQVIVSYQDRDLLESGWLVGEGNITGKAAMISAEMGKGKVVLIGFRAQHRAQTYGTFKLLFNSLETERLYLCCEKTFYIETFGCQMNAHDSEKVVGTLEQEGYAQVQDEAAAGLILYNTCSIRDKPSKRSFIA